MAIIGKLGKLDKLGVETTNEIKTKILPFLKDLRRVLKKHNLSIQIRGGLAGFEVGGEFCYSKIFIGDIFSETNTDTISGYNCFKTEKIETFVCDIFYSEHRIISESYLNETILSLENLVKKINKGENDGK